MAQMQRSQIRLSNGDEMVIIHNLEDFGLNIHNAMVNWCARTDDYSAENFCEYIMSKDTVNILALTEKRFQELSA